MEHKSFDPSMNILHRRSPKLDHLFKPKTIAVVGATEKEGSVGKTLLQNLQKGSFPGKIFPVNPKRDSVLGVKAYKDLKSIPEKIDLCVVVTPAKTVPNIIKEAADLKIPAAVIISAGFKEMGEEGIALEKELLEHAKRSKMRIIGPNCLGIMETSSSLNATFAASMALKGDIAFISQSGALCTAVLDWSLKEKVGFSAFVSIGSMVDVGWGDLIDYFGSDPSTKSILIYMESIGDARSFLSAAREVSLTKPIILIKAGRSEESQKAAVSHTGSLAGSDEAFSAALRRIGVLRVNTIAELFSMAETLAKQPRPKGPKLMIVTNAGGPGVIATDALIQNGGKLASIDPKSMDLLNQTLPAPWSHNNPVDVLGDASADIYAKTIEILQNSPETDGTLVILTPQDMTDPTKTAEKLKPFAQLDKPILASWMGADMVEEGMSILSDLGIPTFSFPDLACKTFAYMWNYTYNLNGIYEVGEGRSVDGKETLKAEKAVEKILEKARSEKRTLLDEVESKQVLEAYKIPCTKTKAATSEEQAVTFAEEIGYPVVLKIYSHTITHKTDVGGVKLNLHSADEVRKAYQEIFASLKKLAPKEEILGVTVQPMIKQDGYELILGSSVDEEFGPVLLFGSGGQLVEVYKDRALGLPPLTTTLARRMMEQTKIYKALEGVRGKKRVDIEKLQELLVQFSHLIASHKWIKECDINPLLVSEERIIAVDARIVLHDLNTDPKDFPQAAIRPYPTEYVSSLNVEGAGEVVIRPIRPEDESKVIRFHKELSKETVRQRYLKMLDYEERVAHNRLIRICFNDYDREIALIVEKGEEILGMIRLSKIPGTLDATFALIVKDQWQHKKIGTRLVEQILLIAENEGVETIDATMLKENFQMEKLCKRLGFSTREEDLLVFAEKKLKKQL